MDGITLLTCRVVGRCGRLVDELRKAIEDYVPGAQDVRQVTEYEIYVRGGRQATVRVLDDGDMTTR